ncbi:hypothetical protein pdam_00022390 [Pocillopora damicornis]|uniref:Uncharacterized protein n=1 Tax=Pocillopora damicornis TaxID=46731 RepID=A0A3M6TIK0_POCDA|nr:hypothetical protein pdam_00022390 [Pocillopora damicornis]
MHCKNAKTPRTTAGEAKLLKKGTLGAILLLAVARNHPKVILKVSIAAHTASLMASKNDFLDDDDDICDIFSRQEYCKLMQPGGILSKDNLLNISFSFNTDVYHVMDLESFKPDCTINYHTGSSSGRSVATDSMQKVTADDGEIMSIKNKKVTRCDATACAEPAAREELAEMSDGEDDENGDEEGDVEYSVSESSDKKEKKVGRKAKWSQQMLDDTVDIIISSN